MHLRLWNVVKTLLKHFLEWKRETYSFVQVDNLFCYIVPNLYSITCKNSGHAIKSLFSEDKIRKWQSHWGATISLHQDNNWMLSVSTISESYPTLNFYAVLGNLYFLFLNFVLLSYLDFWKSQAHILQC